MKTIIIWYKVLLLLNRVLFRTILTFIETKRRGRHGSSARMIDLQKKIDEERKQLEEDRDMVEEEKNRVKEDLVKKEEELRRAQ